MQSNRPQRIVLSRRRAIDLAEHYREGGEPLVETVGRILERYDVMMQGQGPAKTPAAQPAQPEKPPAVQ